MRLPAAMTWGVSDGVRQLRQGRRGLVEQRAAIIEAELAMPATDGPAEKCTDYPLDYYADGYPKLPECLRRTAEHERFRNVARAA